MALEALVVDREMTTLDLLLWRRYRKLPEGFVERTLDINQGLAGKGAILPVGTRVVVEIPAPSASPSVPLVTLWD
jgi:phage tail protein X